MSSQKLFAIALIFFAVSTAWIVLGRTLDYRTATLEDSLSKEVNNLWGPRALVQSAPYVLSGQNKSRSEASASHIRPLKTEATVQFEHHNRYKGLLWFSTYTVDFSGRYLVQAPVSDPINDGATFVFALPDKADFFEKISVTIDQKPTEPIYSSKGRENTLLVKLPADKEPHYVGVSYSTRGRDRWQYALSSRKDEAIRVKDFTLTAETNFRDIDYLKGSRSPSTPAKPTDDDQGLIATWRFNDVHMSQGIGIEMPSRSNAGPLAARMSMFAPISLLFFFTVLFTVVVLKKIPLHPMHYMFISAGFFAFHILLAYLVDIINIHGAFWICAAVSIFLVVSYMRLVAGVRFAVLYVGLAQLVYLIGFSYAFFYPGRTGLTVVIGAVATLFVLMQSTGRVDWQGVFAKPQIRTAKPGRPPVEPPLPPGHSAHS